MTPTLSICIPTYNRANYLDQTLNNILSIVPSSIKVIVYDGNSQDGTKGILKKWFEKYENLQYIIADRNGGVDVDLELVVNTANTDYCWLMSSDDFISNDSISILRSYVTKYDPSVILMDRINCNKQMKIKSRESWLSSTSTSRVYGLTDEATWLEYLNEVRNLGGIFSYISSIVIKRSDWDKCGNGMIFWGTNYNHVPRILNMIKKGGQLLYIKDPLVYCREDNDSFSSNGLINRYLIDFKGYIAIGKYIFKDDVKLLTAFYNIIKRDHNLFRIIKIRSHCVNKQDWENITESLHALGYQKSVIFLSNLIGRNTFIVKSLLKIRRLIKDAQRS
jgi:abequosyltransferase